MSLTPLVVLKIFIVWPLSIVTVFALPSPIVSALAILNIDSSIIAARKNDITLFDID